jgi:hypothetical protein
MILISFFSKMGRKLNDGIMLTDSKIKMPIKIRSLLLW